MSGSCSYLLRGYNSSKFALLLLHYQGFFFPLHKHAAIFPVLEVFSLDYPSLANYHPLLAKLFKYLSILTIFSFCPLVSLVIIFIEVEFEYSYIHQFDEV